MRRRADTVATAVTDSGRQETSDGTRTGSGGHHRVPDAFIKTNKGVEDLHRTSRLGSDSTAARGGLPRRSAGCKQLLCCKQMRDIGARTGLGALGLAPFLLFFFWPVGTFSVCCS